MGKRYRKPVIIFIIVMLAFSLSSSVPWRQDDGPGLAWAEDDDGHDSDHGHDGDDQEGYDRDGSDYGHDGYDQEGYDRDGYDRDGYDHDGYSRKGHRRDGSHHKDRDRSASGTSGVSQTFKVKPIIQQF